MSASLLVETAGPMTSVQDLGRFGAQSLGVPTAGALDTISLRLANALVGNPEGAAGLECRFLGPQVKVIGGPIRIALAGADSPLEILTPERRLVPPGQSVTLQDGQSFRLGVIPDTSCCYLAFAGGFDLPSVYGSQSTYQPSSLGGVQGRMLADGDRIDLCASDALAEPDLQVTRSLSRETGAPVRVVLGPQEDYFTPEAIQRFLSSPYRVSQQSNRMGLRLEGPELAHARGFNIPSDGIVTGAIQVPGSGLPIVLMADRQTTGGYPKIATVISADLPRIGRLRPGETLRFEAVEVAEAEALRRKQEASLRSIIGAMEPVSADAQSIQARLMRENLISGVFHTP